MGSWQQEKEIPALFICVLLDALVKSLQVQMGRYSLCPFRIKTKIAENIHTWCENYIHGWQGTEKSQNIKEQVCVIIKSCAL